MANFIYSMLDRKTSLLIKGYRCFQETPAGFDEIKRFNVIIGKNNVGKSSLLDAVSFAVQPSDLPNGKGSTPELLIKLCPNTEEIKQVFREDRRGGKITGYINHLAYGQTLLDKTMTLRLNRNNDKQLVQIEPETELLEYKTELANAIQNPFYRKSIIRVAAERDIKPEKWTWTKQDELTLSEGGEGATVIFKQLLGGRGNDDVLIKRDLLEGLNTIFNPEAHFSGIEVKDESDGTVEVFLQDSNGDSVALSESGSGLRTAILVLLNFLVMPNIGSGPAEGRIFLLEELENNLHPALQRNLFKFVQEQAIKKNHIVFLTTHSSVAIDFFSANEEAQILHISKNKDKNVDVKRVATYQEYKGILEDLDFRASDLLQANGVIWVEGPSDRVMLNHWISTMSRGAIKEGIHYQCVFYGGRLLSHLSALAPSDDKSEGVSVFSVNRNTTVIIDSDKGQDTEDINATKKRIIEEVESQGGYAWVTQGRELENYYHVDVLRAWCPDFDTDYQFNKLPQLLEQTQGGKYYNATINKVELSVQYIDQVHEMRLGDQEFNTLDLRNRVEDLIERIKEWNRITIE